MDTILQTFLFLQWTCMPSDALLCDPMDVASNLERQLMNVQGEDCRIPFHWNPTVRSGPPNAKLPYRENG